MSSWQRSAAMPGIAWVSLDEVLRRLGKVVHGGERHPLRLLVHEQGRASLHSGQRNHLLKGDVQDLGDV